MQLLINHSAPPPTQPETRFGGLPLIARGSGAMWPHCRACQGPMLFLGQLHAPVPENYLDRLLLLFMCQKDPGSCEEWAADGGGNAVLVEAIGDPIALDPPLVSAGTVRSAVHGARVEEVAGDGYDEARETWSEAHEGKRREVLGHWLGQPEWIQADETPSCNGCGNPMRFVAQLEEGPDYRTSMNFGGGCAYVFDCACDSPRGKMLWQCT